MRTATVLNEPVAPPFTHSISQIMQARISSCKRQQLSVNTGSGASGQLDATLRDCSTVVLTVIRICQQNTELLAHVVLSPG